MRCTRLRRWVPRLGGVLLLAIAVWVAWASPAGVKITHAVGQAGGWVPEHAVATVVRRELNLGTVTAGVDLPVTLEVTNTGGRRLILVEESRSCGCLSGGRAEVLVFPGQAAELEFVLKTDRLRGSVRKAVRYVTNDPKQPTLTFTLIAEVIPRSGAGGDRNAARVAAGN